MLRHDLDVGKGGAADTAHQVEHRDDRQQQPSVPIVETQGGGVGRQQNDEVGVADGIGGVGNENDEVDGILEQADIEELVLLTFIVILVPLPLPAGRHRFSSECAGNGVQRQRGRAFRM